MAEENLGRAVLALTTDDKGLDKGLDAAERKTEGWAGRVGGVLKGGLLVGAGVVAAGFATVGAAIAGVGKAAFDAGKNFDEAFDTIRIGTGKTGAAMDGLKDDFRNVFGSLPTDSKTAADAISELNKRTGMTGDTLRDTAKPLIEMSRLLGGDATTNAALLTRVMGDWGIANKDAAGTLDKLFVANQKTGVSVESLTGNLVKFGAPLRLMGFSLDESIALLSKWEKEGVNTELVMGSLRIAAGKFAKEGKPLKDSLMSTFDQIKKNTNATAALALGMDVFGARAGPDMVAAIREGRFALGDLEKALGSAGGAILATGKATEDFPEKLLRMKNKALLVLEPLGSSMLDILSGMFDNLGPAFDKVLSMLSSPQVQAGMASFAASLAKGIGDAINWLVTTGVPLFQAAMAWIQKAISDVQEWLVSTGVPLFRAAMAWIGAAIETARPFVERLGETWKTIVGVIQTAVPQIRTIIESVIGFVNDFMAKHGDEIERIMQRLWNTILLIVDLGVAAYNNIIKPAFDAIAKFLAEHGDEIKAVIDVVWSVISEIINTALTVIQSIIKAVTQAIAGDWRGFGETLRGIWEALMGRLVDALRQVNWLELGKDIIRGIGNGIGTMGNWLADMARAAARAAWEAIKGFFGLGSGSTSGLSFPQLGGAGAQGMGAQGMGAFGGLALAPAENRSYQNTAYNVTINAPGGDPQRIRTAVIDGLATARARGLR